MAATATPGGTVSPSGTGPADLEDSNVSSPLSEVDDGDANDEDIEHMQIDSRDNDGANSSLSGDDQPNDDAKGDGSDSESALSDAGSDVNSEANDTEAETERLYDTPRHQRQRDVVVDQFNHGEVFEHTPSKLRSASRLDADGEHNADDDSVSGDDASAASDESPIKPAATKDSSVDADNKRESLERKRKRSPMADTSESDQPSRKRTGSVGAIDEGVDDEAATHDDTNPQSGNQTAGEEDEQLTNLEATSDADQLERETRAIKRLSRNGSKKKGAVADDSAGETTGPDANGDHVDTAEEDDTEQQTEDVDIDADEGIDAAAKSIEEAERKSAAFKDWTHIEEMFGIFRDRLYKDRLQRLEEEEQSLLADVPSHPEYLNMKQCLDERLAQKIQEVNLEYEFRIQAHERRAIAMRAQAWSQFFQAVRERREQTLESLNQQWYEVQTARRSAHSLPDYGLLFPKDPVRRVTNAIAYNSEVSTLAGLAKFEGFPAGPELKGASSSEVEADFSAIEQVRRSRQKHNIPVRDEYPNPQFTRLGPAGEQFIKDTPWANPNHSAHKAYQQPPTQTDDRIENVTVPEQPSANSGQANTKSIPAVDGQAAPRKSSVSRQSDSTELSRAMLNQGAHQMKRVGSIANLSRGSKTAAA